MKEPRMTDRRYTFAQATGLAGISPGNLGNWRKRYPELIDSDYFNPPRDGKRAANIDFAGVVFLVIVGRLFKMGLTPPEAAEAAWQFTDVGGVGRDPCQLYELPDRTLLMVVRAVSGDLKARVVGTHRDAGFITAFESLGALEAIILDLNTLLARVTDGLADDRESAA
jgi:hypothetical protein